MFTILPALYSIGVHYFRAWKAPYYYEQTVVETVEETIKVEPSIADPPPTIPESCEKQEPVSKVDNNRNQKIKSRKKKHDRRRRKTSLSELNYDDIMYLIKETGFTRDEIVSWYADFLRDCPDGKLPESKFIDIYQQFYRKGQVEQFCQHAFRLFNKDGSGYMDFIEFLLAVSLTSSKDPVRKLELFFAMYDMDHNGRIDGNEMRAAIESIYQLMGIDVSDPSRIDAKVYELFSKADYDHLGYLRKDQFATACENDRYIRKFLKPNIKPSDHF